MTEDEIDALLAELVKCWHPNDYKAATAIGALREELEESNRLNEEHIAENDEFGASITAVRWELIALKAKYCPEEMTNEQKSAWIDIQWEAANPDRLRPERKEWLAKIEGYAKRLRRA